MADTDKPAFKLPVKTDAELREFVCGVLDGTIFTSAQIPNQADLPLVFMPIALGCYADLTEEQVRTIGVLYAPMKSAAPRRINGLPMFFEVHALSLADWTRVWAAIVAEQERRKHISIPVEPQP